MAGCSDQAVIGAVGFICYSLFELWIGKTGRTKANSLLELVAVFVAMIFIRIMKGQNNGAK